MLCWFSPGSTFLWIFRLIAIILAFLQLHASPVSEINPVDIAGGWGDLSLAFADDRNRHSLLSLTANATRLSYVATHGTYFNSTEAISGVPGNGWVQVPELLRDPISGGFRAVVFKHPATRRGLIAFRGTDLNMTGLSGQADFCADKVLWDNTTSSALPSFCQQFTPETLDYLGHSLELTRKARELLTGFDLLLTGHSLGAGLAILSAAAGIQQKLVLKAVVFSSPGFDSLLQQRLHILPSQLPTRQLRAIYNEFDPVYMNATEKHGIRGATSCLFQGLPEPTSCSICYHSSPGQPSAKRNCLLCFAETDRKSVV